MHTPPPCPTCGSELSQDDGLQFACHECGHEWPREAAAPEAEARHGVRNAYGTQLKDGDTITVIKDLKIKGSSQVVKVGTKAKNIRLAEGDHDIDCKIDGVGAMRLEVGVCAQGSHPDVGLGGISDVTSVGAYPAPPMVANIGSGPPKTLISSQ